MSPELTAAVVWGVLWFFGISVIPFVTVSLSVLIGFVLGGDDGDAVGGLIGWALGIPGAIFATVQFVLQVVSFITILTT